MKFFKLAKFPLVLLVLLVVFAAAAVWFFCRLQPSAQDVRYIILISIDTCRADYLSCYGYPRRTTPNIDALAQEAVLFSNVYTPVPITLPAHSSMLTGTIPPYHGVHYNLNYRLSSSNLTLAEIMHQHGYRTAAIIGAFVLDSLFGLDQGFDTYNDQYLEPIESMVGGNERRAAEVTHFACDFLEEHGRQPFFLFLHYYDPHFPYEPPEPFASVFWNNPYAGEIAYTDRSIGVVIEKLKDLGLYDSALIIITGDHGEMLGEHNEYAHGYFIYQSSLKVPLVVKLPGKSEHKKVDDAVGLIDIVPTTLGYLGIAIPGEVQGKDLSQFFKKKSEIKKNERHIYCESLLPTQYGCTPLLGLVNDRWKYIQAPRPELYDISKDPREAENLVNKHPKRARLLQKHLEMVLQDHVRIDRSDSKFVLDEESRKRLESLGYVGGDISEDFEFDSTKDDPKDLIGLHQQTMVVKSLINTEQYPEAEAVCRQILAERPQYVLTYSLLGKIAFGRNNMAESIAHFSEFLSRVSDANASHSLEQYVVEAYHHLGMAFLQQEDFDQAITYLSKALEIEVDSSKTYYNLGIIYHKLGKLDEAVTKYNKALDIDPDFPEAHYNLGNLLRELGKFDAAIVHYKEALRLKPGWEYAQRNLYIAETMKNKP